MSVPIVTEARPTQPYERGRNGRVATRDFQVLAKSPPDAEAVIGTAGEVMDAVGGNIVRGTPYKTHKGDVPDPFVRCTRISVRTLSFYGNDDADGFYHVTCFYNIPQLGSQSPPEPTELTTQWRVEPTSTAAATSVDVNGYSITNTAGEPIAGVTKIVQHDTLVGTRLFTGSSYLDVWGQFAHWRGKVNAGTWFGAPPRCVLVRSVLVEETSLILSGLRLFRVTFRFDFRPPIDVGIAYARNGPKANDFQAAAASVGGWVTVLFNQGDRQIKPTDDGDRWEVTKDADGVPARLPLGQDGQALAIDAPMTHVAYELYPTANFSSLPI